MKPDSDLMEDFNDYVQDEMENLDLIARNYEYDTYTPLEYIA